MNGRQHRRLNLVVAPAIIGSTTAGAYYLSGSVSTMVVIQAAIVSAFMFQYAINPDLDLLENSIAAKRSRTYIPEWFYDGEVRQFAWLFLRTLYAIGLLYLWPYSAIIPHRHPLSHAPLLGTVIRLLYTLWPLILAWPFIELYIGIIPVLTFILTVSVLDTLHWFADGMPMRAFIK